MTPTSLQKIVDGEMTQEMLAIALQEFESDPSKWRTLAMALLEEQQWAKQIAQIQRSREAARISPANHGVDKTAVSNANTPAKHFAFLGGSAGSGSARSAMLGALAASLILGLGFAAGMLVFDGPKPAGISPDSVATTSWKPRIDTSSPQNASSYDDGMKMVVTGPNDETAEIPIYDLGEIDPREMWAKEDFQIALLKEQLRRKGYQLEVRPEYYTSKLNDGRQLVVPVKNVGLKPYGL